MMPPGPRGWLPGGALLSFPREPEAFCRVARTWGDLTSWRVGRQQFFLVNHPDLVREAFVTKHDRFVKGWGPQAGNSVLGSGLITAEGALHRSERRLLLPGFHRQRLEQYCDVMLRHAQALRDRWDARIDLRSGRIDLLPEVRRTTMNILGEALFGTDLSGEFDRLAHASDVVFRRFAGRMSLFARPLRLLRIRSTKAADAVRRDLHDFAARVLAERRATPADDIVSMLVEAGVPDDQIRDEIVTFFFAGHETVSLTTAWAWRLLARNPDAQARLHAELDTVLGGREPRVDDLRRLVYTQGVIAETLRLYPSQWMIGRRAVEDVEVGGCTVPRGAIVLLCLPALHRDPRWFDGAAELRPERWAAGVEKSAPPFTFLPFGVGLRRCIGEGFAWMEATVLLATIARDFEVEPAPHLAMRSEALLLLRPTGDPLRFRSRMRFQNRV